MMNFFKCSWTLLCVLLFSSINAESDSNPSKNPCTDFLKFEKISNDLWNAQLTLISDSDLKGIWVRILTEPVMENLEVSDNFNVKYSNETTSSEIRISNREFHLKSGNSRKITLKGRVINGKVPELISLTLNGKLICSSEKHGESVYFNGDFNGDYLISIQDEKKIPESVQKQFEENCGKHKFQTFPSNKLPIWQAELLLNQNGKLNHLCEATLISKRAFLTSAHCVTWKNSRRLISRSSLEIKLKNFVKENLNIENILIHPNFEENTLMNDLAIVKLEKSLTDENIRPICLPSTKSDGKIFISGYGFGKNRTLTNYGIVDEIRKIDDGKCAKLESAFENLINDENYCAIYSKDYEICFGSSGSSVMHLKSNVEDVWELDGILNVGRARHENYKCNTESPVLVTDISKYLKWVKKNVD